MTEATPASKDLLKARLKHLVRERMGVTGGWHPLSPGQQALWFLWQLAPDSWAYSMVLTMTANGPLDLAALGRALQIVADRHGCLRTEFREEAGVVTQRALRDAIVAPIVHDASDWSGDRLEEAVGAEARRPFDLLADATLRVMLFRSGPDRHVILVALPHIVGDLWSLVILMDELRQAYAGEISGHPAVLPPLSLDHEDYVRASVTDPGDLDYWREALAGELPVLDLPTDRPRPSRQSFSGGTITSTLDGELVGGLEVLAAREGTTLFTVLLTAYQALLHRYSGQDAIVVGMPTSGRQRAGLADVIGDFVNMLPIRTAFETGTTFRNALVQVRTRVLGALDHQGCPLSAIVEAVEPIRDASRSPIFQTTFVLQSFQRYPELQGLMLPDADEPPVPFANLTLSPWPLSQQEGQFDLNLEMKRTATGGLRGAWKFAADLFDAQTIERIAITFETLLRRIVADPDQPIAHISLLTEAERSAVLAAGRGPIVSRPSTIVELFERRVAHDGDAIAVRCGDQALSYAALDARTCDVASALRARGVGRETLVAVAMRRDADFVVTLLAIIRSGGAFLPLDHRHPVDRLATLITDSGARLVVCDTSERASLIAAALAEEPSGRVDIVCLETLVAQDGDAPLACDIRGSDLAYVMYTSGSTGRPKGAMIEHRGMANHMLAKLDDLGFGPGDVLAQNAPASFDVVVWQAVAPLLVGGTVAIVPDAVAGDPAALIEAVRAQGITMLQVVPSMLRGMLDVAEGAIDGAPDLGKLRWMIPTGEALPADLCRRWFALYPSIPILNTYGSTECSDDQCHYRLDGPDLSRATCSIGRPISNMAAHVLDANRVPVPDGVVGELYIGGLGVGRGYRGDPDRTAAAFVADPYCDEPEARLYRTRDIARRRPDGLIDFLGRTDQMVKLNGLRIEPGEIEQALCLHPAVRAAAVIARAREAGGKQLVAYVAGDAVPSSETLRSFLAQRLPFTMIPAVFITMEALPLTPNGKLDQTRLPAPAATAADSLPPRSDAEHAIAAIWRGVLDEEQIGVDQDFFAAGGDSIRSIQVAARCRQAGFAIDPADIFVHRTIAALAALGATEASPSTISAAPIATADRDRALAMVSFATEPCAG